MSDDEEKYKYNRTRRENVGSKLETGREGVQKWFNSLKGERAAAAMAIAQKKWERNSNERREGKANSQFFTSHLLESGGFMIFSHD